MPNERPKYSFFLLDTPSDHEIEGGLVTECQIIKTILHNRNFQPVVKTEVISSVDRFNQRHWRAFKGLGYVHVAGHGSKKGLELLGGTIKWSKLASILIRIAPSLASNQKRVVTLSCCYSEHASRKLIPLLKGHFTGVYYFSKEEVKFADAITAYTMFYRRKTIDRPHKRIVEDINGFLGKRLFAFDLV